MSDIDSHYEISESDWHPSTFLARWKKSVSGLAQLTPMFQLLFILLNALGRFEFVLFVHVDLANKKPN